jgi:hypothetical protein
MASRATMQTHDRTEKSTPDRQRAIENPRENGRATVRFGHRPRIRRVPWSIVDGKLMTAIRTFNSLSVGLLRAICHSYS